MLGEILPFFYSHFRKKKKIPLKCFPEIHFWFVPLNGLTLEFPIVISFPF